MVNLRLTFCWLIALLIYLVALTCWSLPAARQAGGDASSISPKPMEVVFKNIQVLKGVPSTEQGPIMHFMRASLGVRCEYCHVAEDGKYYLDTKMPKQRAREMILMTRRLNESNFGGRSVITCNTCHQGSTVPNAQPPLGSNFLNVIRRMPGEPQPVPLPSVAEIFQRYEEATHVNELRSASVTLEGCHAKLVDVGTPRAIAVPRAACNTVEALMKLDENGDKALTTSPLSGGQSARVGSDGKRGWIVGPDGLHWISDSEFLQFQRKLIPLLVSLVRPADFTSSSVSRTDVIDGHETYVVSATGLDGAAQELWFSRNDGLLIRRTYYHPFLFGAEPERFDLSNYKSFGEIKLPSRINTSYLDDQHLGVLKTLINVKLGVPAPDQEFIPPSRWPAQRENNGIH